MRAEAERRIGHLYPPIEVTADLVAQRPDLRPLLGQKLTVIAWLWARTVRSPNPAYRQAEVPLASTFLLSSKSGKEAWVQPIVEGDQYRFTVRVGTPPAEAKNGTKLARGANFRCLLSDSPIEPDYIYNEANAGRMGARLMAIVAEGKRGRVYLSPTEEHETIAKQAEPTWEPEVAMPENPRWFSPPLYGLKTYGDLFTPRQLVALTTFSDLIAEAIARVKTDALAAGLEDRDEGLEDSLPPKTLSPNSYPAPSARAYAEAVGVYLAAFISRMIDLHNNLCQWRSDPSKQHVGHLFSRQAIPMIWDYAEANPFGNSAGGFTKTLEFVPKILPSLVPNGDGIAVQADAQTQRISTGKLVSTDPPYYDNIGYADLSDFFYVWLRRSLRPIYPDLFATLAVPKAEELVATPYRHGNKQKAEAFFLDGMTEALRNLARQAHPAFPVTIYYAFKQSETKGEAGTSSTGWETFLEAVLQAGFALTGTWPMRTELGNRMIGSGTNALASSIVLVCRPRAAHAATISRRELIRELNAVLPEALLDMTRGGVNSPVAPVDLSQAIIGPGMAIFSQYAAVLEADGTPMTVRTALQLINRYLSEDDFDHDTQFCLSWFEEHGWAEGKYGDADVLARAKGTSVSGLVEAGVVESAAGRLRLLRWAELPAEWSPATDTRVPVWEALHQLIRGLNHGGEGIAGALLAQMAGKTSGLIALTYRLYTLCERKGWAEAARAYNELQGAWSAIEQAASAAPEAAAQGRLEF